MSVFRSTLIWSRGPFFPCVRSSHGVSARCACAGFPPQQAPSTVCPRPRPVEWVNLNHARQRAIAVRAINPAPETISHCHLGDSLTLPPRPHAPERTFCVSLPHQSDVCFDSARSSLDNEDAAATADCRMTAAEYLLAITPGVSLPPPQAMPRDLEPRRAPPPDGAFLCTRTAPGGV